MTEPKRKRGGSKPQDGMTNKEFSRRLGDRLIKSTPIFDPDRVSELQRDKEKRKRFLLYLNTSKLR